MISVVTGELKCRGHYIDENGLDVHRHRVPGYPLERMERLPTWVRLSDDNDAKASEFSEPFNVLEDKITATEGMCNAVFTMNPPISPSIECLRHAATSHITFDVVRILPASGPMIESSEAVVIVVGDGNSYVGSKDEEVSKKKNDGDWYDRSDLNASILHMIKRLSNAKDCSWLSKTVFFVSPTTTVTTESSKNRNTTSSSSDLNSVVNAFIASYMGNTSSNSRLPKNKQVFPLPPHFSYPMIRSLLVLIDAPSPPYSINHHHTEVRILPQGTSGVLPNLDLVFATFLSFQSQPEGVAGSPSSSFNPSRMIYYGDSEFRMHSYGRWERTVRKAIDGWGFGSLGDGLERVLGWKKGKFREGVAQYAMDLAGWFGFLAVLFIGP